MSNNKQSSVEFILNNIHLKDSLKWQDIIEQAKAMHNKEIEKAFDNGVNAYYDINSPSNWEQYYNETFGGNNEME
jgi:hypothetical protein